MEEKVGASEGHLGLSESPPVRSEEYSRSLTQDPSRKRYRPSESHLPNGLTGIAPSYGAADHYSQGNWGSSRQAETSTAYPLYSPQGFSHPHYGEAPSGRRDTLNQGFPQGDSPALKRRKENSDHSPEMGLYNGEPVELDETLFQK